ncbi:SMP-30/gluconolactonase/LRE family protein [Aquabacterium sp.]|uniref:SMP-30/gluconolactonase/LRE family protein n=1 Tax=Aquabacterium sp. TaxID=1872578 RepID=UPI003D6C851D
MKQIKVLKQALTVTLLAGVAVQAGAQVPAPATTLIVNAIPGVVAAGTKVELIKEGFSGTEGPVGLADGSLIFTETQVNRITRIWPDGTVTGFLDNTNGANGLGFTPNGDLYAVQVQRTRVGIIHPSTHAKTLTEGFEGKPFGRPNDLVVDKKGNVYFTDSGANGALPPGAPEPAKPAVYRISSSGEVKRLASDVERPNGIQLSPDDKVLYVANTNGEHVLAYDIAADGSVGPKRQFAKLEVIEKTSNGGVNSGADGLAVDDAGRVYVASNKGIEIFSSKGEALGSITLPKKPQNLAFAGPDKKTLYAVGRGAAYRFPVLTAGVSGRAK